ncbi:hypothetical protein [Bartonella rattimassiliensis]|uniref:Uncharacterized protein n=1 Tax=Bartonella rattimassiliensis 15908 TaxID=1094556 RepID=J0QPD9_9HYPH|nr:hypothetical protein [Bartonella rattimassiliensis]EJF84874.1 hypothetical protein MCY_01426 [Bartonella rattimassiliensis 15908]
MKQKMLYAADSVRAVKRHQGDDWGTRLKKRVYVRDQCRLEIFVFLKAERIKNIQRRSCQCSDVLSFRTM